MTRSAQGLCCQLLCGLFVFPCGVTVADDGDTLHMYYGGADSCIALATASIRELLDWLRAHGRSQGTGDERGAV
jgi:hypothetical protein